MADPRAGDVAEAEWLFAEAEAKGVTPLPTLSAAELWVLCGTDQVLAAPSEVRWWTGLSDPEREKLTAAILDLLTYRELLRPADGEHADHGPEGTAGLPMAPELAMIVAARQYPAVVALAKDADGSAEGAPRMYGLAQDGQPTRALVGEFISARKTNAPRPFGPLHVSSLMSPRHAGHVLAVWATAADTSRSAPWKRSRKDRPRIVDIYQHPEGETLTCDRVTVAATEDQHTVTRQRPDANPDPPAVCDQDGLASLLAGILTRARP